jgi:hypothetical protein
MAIKTFTTGEVLTASDTNTYLANSGLVYVTDTSFSGTGFSINNCFTSTYDNYRIEINGYANSNADLSFRFRSSGSDLTTTVYQYASQGSYGGVRNDAAGTGQTAIGFTPSMGNNRYSGAAIEVYGPNTTYSWKTTNTNCSFSHDATGVIVRNVAGACNSATQFDGFSIITGGATIVGTCTVYGYRKA